MKTVFANTEHPVRVKWLTGTACFIGLALFVACLVFWRDVVDLSWIFPICWSLFYFGFLLREYKLRSYVIDDEADTLTDSQQKKYPLKLSELATLTYKENKKGKFRSLIVHDSGIGFIDVRTSRENADRMVARIREVNPAVEVRHANYL